MKRAVAAAPFAVMLLVSSVRARKLELVSEIDHTNTVSSIAFSSDGRTLASANVDKTVKLWEVGTGHELRSLAGQSDSVLSIDFSPDGRSWRRPAQTRRSSSGT